MFLLYFIECLVFFSIVTARGDQEAKDESLYPEIINVASSAFVSANATCGQNREEYYCKHSSGFEKPQCSVCDKRSPDPSRRHCPDNIIDGTNTWWQSPSLAEGMHNEWVTVTLDLRQTYEVAYVIVKCGISPRPGNWILERSLDNINFQPWQFYAVSDYECNTFYNREAFQGNQRPSPDSNAICTSYFSKLEPTEGGEIHTSLMSSQQDKGEFSRAMRDFTSARYVRLRFQKIVGKSSDETDTELLRQYFYSIKDISIGGRCVCNGHAKCCSIENQMQRCECEHNTCGDQCDRCCPLFNQRPWKFGVSCEPCQCNNHADSCRYDQVKNDQNVSRNIKNRFEGGGVCDNCRDFTAGVNCETCQAGYYRPKGVAPDESQPCIPCTCSGIGTNGNCISDDSQANLGRQPGDCICEPGFKGKNCEQCDDGYLNYPRCDPCPCSRAGSSNNVCEGNCVCKENVMGPSCDTCIPGTFHLDVYNKVGCTTCFCNHVTDKCEAARLAVYIISVKEHWKVCDLLQRRVIAASVTAASISIEREEMSAYKAYYFLAPEIYLGKRITSYGQMLSIRASWVKLRGDISGSYTRCPDIIIEGGRFKISYGAVYYKGQTSMMLQIPLYEQGWFHMPKDLGDISYHMEVEKYQMKRVTREEMMEVLSNIKSLMVRARYHTEQVESTLHDVIFETGMVGATITEATLLTRAVEKCFCPPGYTGLSCEYCEPGFRRVDNIIVGGKCERCNCNGHVEKCDPFTGECGECLHNTVGKFCELCAPGFYGDATKGTPDDCKPCECPHRIGKNEFIPKCEADPITGGFRCICPRGYEGPRCERCADGYFGNPLIPGRPCRPCNCSGHVDPFARGNCDPVTGQCLKCLGNTAGFNCERCKENHFGSPERGQCFKCNCHPLGSLSPSCDPESGQCPCKPLFTGKKCELCVKGRGGIKEGCPLCGCNRRGSVTEICDQITGLCTCKPGVGGRNCDRCLENHFGDINIGCSECNCDPKGSLRPECDLSSGQCQCRPFVVGRTCSMCKLGYWGLRTIGECRPCDCVPSGTSEVICDQETGNCLCLPGVGGPNCDRCLPGYWGFSATGCRPCEPCGFPGKNCDLTTGRCVCPPNTEGDKCERCSQGFWDYSPDIGCRACRCSGPGSLERQCDPRTGRCYCQEGYMGDQCDRCSYGYYGYPNCRRCNCNIHGTIPRMCKDEGTCQCEDNGQCPCKENVRGLTCSECKSGTFGLSAKNSLGCFSCYCFTRSSDCRQADLTWSQLDLPGERSLLTGHSSIHLNITNQLYVLPETKDQITVGFSLPPNAPLYWQLPREFMRDQVTSYNGMLRFKVNNFGTKQKIPVDLLQSYPLVSIQGNWQIVMQYFTDYVSPDGYYEVRLHEDLWQRKDYGRTVNREEMMIALQDVQNILIRGTDAQVFSSSTLSHVSLDVAVEGTPISSRLAEGVEMCVCPRGYAGTSCQDPDIGYYRWCKENSSISTIIIDYVGVSKPCECNGRSDRCDSETGECIGCTGNTAGFHCELCKTGFYGNPNIGPCLPCACPSNIQNFATTCVADIHSGYICHCQEGYTGNKCDRCAEGYYGNPTEIGGFCRPCNCDPHGSIGKGCDQYGNCKCRQGIIGRDCSQCKPRHIVSENGCTSCEDGCVDVLLDDIEILIRQVDGVDFPEYIPAPWASLYEIRNLTLILTTYLEMYESRVNISRNMLLSFGLESEAKLLLVKSKRVNGVAFLNINEAYQRKIEALEILNLLRQIRVEIEVTVSILEDYALGGDITISVQAALHEAEFILRMIKLLMFESYRINAVEELRRAQLLLNRVRQMMFRVQNVDAIYLRYREMVVKVGDMVRRVGGANDNIKRAKQLIVMILRMMSNVRVIYEEGTFIATYVEERNFNSSLFVQTASRNIDNVNVNYVKISVLISTLKVRMTELTEYERHLWTFVQQYERYVIQVEHHAMNLTTTVLWLERLFNDSLSEIDRHLLAAQAYDKIVEALHAARIAAENALIAAQKAFDVAFNFDTSIIQRCKWSLEKSIQLLKRAKSLEDSVKLLLKFLHVQRNKIEYTNHVLDGSERIISLLRVQFKLLVERDLTIRIQRTLGNAETVGFNIDVTLDLIEEIHANLIIMLSYAQKLAETDTTLHYNISSTIEDVNSKIDISERMCLNLISRSNTIKIRGGNLRNRIDALKRKIQQTRQHATSIKVSLTTDENGICTRKYRPYIYPSTTTRITLGYTINSDHRNAHLFYIGSSNKSDFMAIDMIDRRIHFTWNAGGGAKTIVHPLTLETNNPLASDETKWYHVSINRIGNIGEVSVRPAFFKNNRKMLYSEPVTGASPPGYTRMDLYPWDFAWIGRNGDTGHHSGYKKQNVFRGCLHYVTIDGEPLGLWNFTESIGCAACNEGFELEIEEQDKTTFSFNGKGYFKGSNRVRRRKMFYSLIFSFKTLDEDALLFLSYNEVKKQYISIFLQGGQVHFRVKFDEKIDFLMKSETRYNTNQLIQIQADVQISLKGGTRQGKLVIGDQVQIATVVGGPDLDLLNSPFYFGGVDPEFNRRSAPADIELRSLLGCMGGISVLELGKNPHVDGQSYGIGNTCPEEPLTEIGFSGKGFVEMPSKILKKDANFGFSFRTKEPNALLMVSTFIGQPQRSGVPNPPDYYSVSLVNGRLDLRLFAGNGRHQIMTRNIFNDGKLHSFFAIKENRKVKLYVDDKMLNSTKLGRRSQLIEGPEGGGLFFGGAPYDFNLRKMVGSMNPLKGCIQDVIINDVVVPFNNPIRFRNAFVGRCEAPPSRGPEEGNGELLTAILKLNEDI